MIVVSPYRPFVPESTAHQRLGPFDWLAALAMLRVSVRRACQCETYVLTDPETSVGETPAYGFATSERRLMLWILEVSLAYLRSDQFTEDTVMISPDTLVLQDLAPWFRGADLGVLARGPKFPDKPILNGVQWWAVRGQTRLVAFYERALALATTLPEPLIRWGADTVPLVQLLAPIHGGRKRLRAGLTVDFIDSTLIRPTVVMDFKGLRKHDMARTFTTQFRSAVPA